MRGYQVDIAIRRDDGEHDAFISGTFYPGDPGRVCGRPEDCYPPEPGEYEIESAVGPDGESIELTDSEVDRAFDVAQDTCPDEWDEWAYEADRDDRLDDEIERSENALLKTIYGDHG